MTWVRLDDNIFGNSKLVSVDGPAKLLHIISICYSAQNLTDGRIGKGAVKLLALQADSKPRHLTQLVDAGLWNAGEDGAWFINDYLEYNPSREKVLLGREVAKRRKALNDNPLLREAIRDRDGNRCRYCDVTVNWRDRRGKTGGTYDHVVPVSRGGSDELDNLVVSCLSCNVRKGVKTPEQAGMVLLGPGPDLDPNLDPTKRFSRKPDPDTSHPTPLGSGVGDDVERFAVPIPDELKAQRSRPRKAKTA